ncbi:ATP synthase subunit a, partial [Stegodyphus mimosarum]
MMIRLFSVFDPTSYLGIYLNFIILFLVIMYFPIKYFMVRRGYNRMRIIFSGEINKIFNEVSYPDYRGIVYICVVTFLYLILRNMVGLFPFVFTSTAHPIITLGLGVVF